MTKPLIKLLVVLFMLLSFSPAFCQPNADSLKQVIRNSDNVQGTVDALNSLSKLIIDSNPDSALALSSSAYNQAKKALYDKGVIASSNMLGNYYQRKGDFKKSIAFYNESRQYALKTNDLQGLAGVSNNMGIIYVNQGNFPAALKAFIDGLNYEQKRGDKKGMAECYNNIAVVHYFLKEYSKFIEYLKKSVAMSESVGDLATANKGYNNIGAFYEEQKKYDEALSWFSKSAKICKQINSKKDYTIAIQNMANMYAKKKDYSLAQQYYNETVMLKKELQDYVGLATVYSSIGDFYTDDLKQYDKALENLNMALSISREKGFRDIEKQVLMNFSDVYKEMKDYKKALEYQVKGSLLKDSIFTLEKAKSMQELQTKYETVEKEKELAQEKANVANSKLVIKNRNNTIMLVCAGFVLSLVVAGGWYNRNQYRQRQYRKEVELKQLLAEAELKNKIQGERERISRDLHDHIGSQLTLMISGLDTMSYKESENHHEDAAKRLNDLSDQARDTMGQLRETIWAMNKEEVSVNMLVSKIQEFSNKANRSISTAVSGDGKVALSPAKSLALFRVCQEAVNNAIKHAEFKTLSINFNAHQDKIDVLIKDDGKGFDPIEVASRGYGLENMAFRLEECGGKFHITSTPGQGTEIKMEVFLN